MPKRRMNRREFLKSSTTSLGALLFLSPGDPRTDGLSVAQQQTPRPLPHRVLGKTGIKLPVITMGAMNSDNPSLIRAALDAGMKHLDTAHSYMQGRNEQIIGEVLKGRPRDSFYIATKVDLPKDGGTGLYGETATENLFLNRLDISLKRLGLDYVDILYHHNIWKREAALYEPVLNAMAKAKKAGKIRFPGISTHRNEPEVIRAAIDSKFYEVIQTAYNFQQKHQEEMKKAIASAAQADLGIVAMKAIGGVWRGYFGWGPADAQVALKWVLQDSNVTTIIAGFTTFDELAMDIKIMQDMALTKSEKSHLQRIMGLTSLYCQGCEKCLSSCRQKLPIPDLIRAYMYLYGYRNAGAAQDLLASLHLPAQVCGDCASCSVKCITGFPVSSRIREVVRLREVHVQSLP